jgi:hypothetical protein
VEHAKLYVNRARHLPETSVDDRNELYRLGGEQVDKVLQAAPQNGEARIQKAYILMHNDPIEAVALMKETLKLDQSAKEEQAQLMASVHGIRAIREGGDGNLAMQTARDITAKYKRLSDVPRLIGDAGPLRLLPAQLALTEAYERAGQYEKARDELYHLGEHEKLWESPTFCCVDLASLRARINSSL